MELADALGYLGMVLLVASSSMRTMTPLRVLSIASNLTFIGYSLVEGLLPLFILCSLLLTINSIRLLQMQRFARSVEKAVHGDLALTGLLPFMTTRKVERGEILFRKHEVAREMFYLVSGEIRLQELGRTVEAGAVLGEIGMFSPDWRRTATAICATDGEVLEMTAAQVRRLYFQEPRFGFLLVQLLTRRLIENCTSLEALPRRRPEPERLHARPAA
jgi:CRP/FNR family transcriptional regulator, cyclic AMP receptor protein